MTTQQRLKELLTYNPNTGDFIRNKVCSPRQQKGDVAGTIKKGYVSIKIDYKDYKAHRLAWLYMTGEWPEYEIDHIDEVKSNNRWSNLREATRSQNAAARTSSSNSAGLRGVEQISSGKWRASLFVNRTRIYIGTFLTKEDAHKAYIEEKEKRFGEFSNEGKISPMTPR